MKELDKPVVRKPAFLQDRRTLNRYPLLAPFAKASEVLLPLPKEDLARQTAITSLTPVWQACLKKPIFLHELSQIIGLGADILDINKG